LHGASPVDIASMTVFPFRYVRRWPAVASLVGADERSLNLDVPDQRLDIRRTALMLSRRLPDVVQGPSQPLLGYFAMSAPSTSRASHTAR
jgi:hypothetical protein